MPAASPPKVFLSAGRTETPEQEQFVTAVIQSLQEEGFEVVRALWSSEQPLKPIWRKMRESAGTVVLAFERFHSDVAIEFRGSRQERRLQDVAVPTVWNQIEAAMAYTLGHPLLVIVQEGLREEGLLEGRYDWYVLRVPLDPAALSQREFRGVFNDWKGRVVEARGRDADRPEGPAPVPAPETLTVGQLVAGLKPAQLWAVMAAIATALAAIVSASFAFGKFMR